MAASKSLVNMSKGVFESQILSPQLKDHNYHYDKQLYITFVSQERSGTMISKPVEQSFHGPTLGSSATHQGRWYYYEPAAMSLLDPFTVSFLLTVWELQIQSHAILLMLSKQMHIPENDISHAWEIFCYFSSNCFTLHSGGHNSDSSQSPSPIGNLEYTWDHQTPSGSSSSSSHCAKHCRTDDGGKDEDDDDRPSKRPKISLNYVQKGGGLGFACHFHIYDPSRYSANASDTKYSACAGPGWSDLTRLKKHLHREHSATGICLDHEMNFSNLQQLGIHCDTEGRYSTEVLTVDGMTSSQYESIRSCIRRCTQAGISPEEQWFKIWNILFPETSRPKCPWYDSKPNVRPVDHKEEQTEKNSQQPRSAGIEPNLTASTSAEIFVDYHDDKQFDNITSNSSSSMAPTPSLMSNTASTLSTAYSDQWSLDNTALKLRLPSMQSAWADRATPNNFELSSQGVLEDSLCSSPIAMDIHPYGLDFPTYIADDLYWNNQVRHGLSCSPTTGDVDNTPFQSAPGDDDTLKHIQELEVEATATTMNRLSNAPTVQNVDVDCHTPCEETVKNASHPMDSWPSDVEPMTGSDNLADCNMNRWLQESVDPFEDKRRAVFETLESEPKLATSAIALFESQWKLESLVWSPGSVSCATEGTTAQSSTPPPDKGSTSKRKASTQWTGSSQPNRLSGQEDEDDDGEERNSRPKRSKGNTDLEEWGTKRKFCCPFHKRHPTIYCLNKDPNLGTREQKRWSLCGAQGFPYLRHLIDHLKSHQVYDCHYCFEQFDHPSEYLRHRTDGGGTCASTERLQGPRRDGIDLQQWTKIEEINRQRSTKIYKDLDKWMDTWEVIFPGIPRPTSPWSSEIDEVEEGVQLPASNPEIEAFFSRLRTLVQAKINNGHKIDQGTYELCISLGRQAIEMGAREKRIGSQHATSIPTPVSSNNVPGTPLSTQESSVDGFRAPQPRNISMGRGRMSRPAFNASPSLARMSDYAGSPNALVTPSYAAMGASDMVQDPSHQVYQSVERKQTPRLASSIPPQYSEYFLERPLQRAPRISSPSHNSRGYSAPNRIIPQVHAVGDKLSSVAQPVSASQEALSPNEKSLASLLNSHTRGTYAQPRADLSNNISNRMDSQQTNMVHQPTPETQEDSRIKQMVEQMVEQKVAQIMAINSSGSPRFPTMAPQSIRVNNFEEQSNQSMLPQQQQGRDTNQNIAQRGQRMVAVDSPQGNRQFIYQQPAANRNENTLEGQTPALGRQPLPPISAAAAHDNSQAYPASSIIGDPMLSDPDYWQGPRYMSRNPDPVLSEQYQMQASQLQMPINSDLDDNLGFSNYIQNESSQEINPEYTFPRSGANGGGHGYRGN